MLFKLGKGDQAGKRSNQDPAPADIYGQKQRTVVVGKMGQEHWIGDVADQLAEDDADKQGIHRENLHEEPAYLRDSCYVPAEDKESVKRRKQRIIDFLKGLTVEEQ